MYKIAKPNFDLEEHLNNCVVRCRNKQELVDFIPEIINQADLYEIKAMNGQLFTLIPLNIPFDGNRLINLYETHMRNKKYNGRIIYDQLILLATNRLCPLCSTGFVSTLDHYLPKKNSGGFPELSTVPINLVPCCSDCNNKKYESVPNTANEQFIHPYYDDINQERWLFAKVSYEIDNEPTIIFYIDCPKSWNETIKARIKYHFETLKLDKLYSQQAANELSGIKLYIDELRRKTGKDSVREHLTQIALSREASNKNSWQTAMYYALANDEKFLEL